MLNRSNSSIVILPHTCTLGQFILERRLSSTRVAARVDALRPFAIVKEDAEYWADLAADEDRIEDVEPGEVTR